MAKVYIWSRIFIVQQYELLCFKGLRRLQSYSLCQFRTAEDLSVLKMGEQRWKSVLYLLPMLFQATLPLTGKGAVSLPATDFKQLLFTILWRFKYMENQSALRKGSLLLERLTSIVIPWWFHSSLQHNSRRTSPPIIVKCDLLATSLYEFSSRLTS